MFPVYSLLVKVPVLTRGNDVEKGNVLEWKLMQSSIIFLMGSMKYLMQATRISYLIIVTLHTSCFVKSVINNKHLQKIVE